MTRSTGRSPLLHVVTAAATLLLGAVTAAAVPAQPQMSAAEVLSRMRHQNEVIIDLGERATDVAQSEMVRRLGDRLARDHRMGDRKVKQLAEELGVTRYDVQSDAEVKKAVGKLEKLEGEEFDQAYLSLQVEMHEKSIRLLSIARSHAEGEPLGLLLDELIPILEQHLALAKHVQAGELEIG